MKKFSTSYVLIPLLFISIYLFNSCTNSPSNPVDEKTISGVIVDEQNNPVPYAILEVYSNTTAIASEFEKDTTDEDGNYMLANLPDDINKLMVKISHQDFKTYEDNLTSFKSKNKSRIKLLHNDTCKGAVSLFTFNDKDSSALSNVEVRMFRSGQLIRKALTIEGKLTFTNICPGTYLLRLFKPGFKLIYDSTYVPADDSIPLPRSYFMTQTDTCCNGLIAVTVKDSVSGNVIEGASVYLWSGSQQSGFAKTDKNGFAQFIDICEGDFTMKIVMDGYNYRYITPIHMNCNDTNISTQYLVKQTNNDSCCTGVLITKVVDVKDSGAIEGATVVIFRNGAQFSKGTTGSDGIFTATNLCAPATYTVKAYKDGYNYQYVNVSFTKCDTKNLTIALMSKSDADSCCHGKIEVTVKDSSNGNVLEGTSVYLYLGSTKIGAGYTDNNGFISFDKICPGDYTLRMQKDNYNLKYVTIKMGCNDTNASIQYLSKKSGSDGDSCCHGKIEATVKDSLNGEALPNTLVYLYLGSTKLGTGYTDNNGFISFDKICPGDYKLRMQKDPYNVKYVNIIMKCNDTNSSTYYLSKKQGSDTCCTAVISTTVLDSADNTPIEGATVYIFKSGGQQVQGTTDKNGNFTASNLCAPASYTVKALKSGYNYQYVPLSFTKCDTVNVTIKLLKK